MGAGEEEAEAPDTEEVEDWDPVGAVQSALAEADPTALVAGFVCIVEWLEADGSNAISVLRTPMPPWHLKGLIEYAADFDTGMYPVMVDLDDDEWDE